MLIWLSENAALLAASLPIAWAAVQFVFIRRQESRKATFETYHRLIKELVERERPDAPMRVDRQVAIVFELRHFKRYRPVTLRILRGLRKEWEREGDPRVKEELDLTIAELDRHHKSPAG